MIIRVSFCIPLKDFNQSVDLNPINPRCNPPLPKNRHQCIYASAASDLSSMYFGLLRRHTVSTWHERTESTSFAERFVRLDPPLFLPSRWYAETYPMNVSLYTSCINIIFSYFIDLSKKYFRFLNCVVK